MSKESFCNKCNEINCLEESDYFCQNCSDCSWFCSNHAVNHILASGHKDVKLYKVILDSTKKQQLIQNLQKALQIVEKHKNNLLSLTKNIILAAQKECESILNLFRVCEKQYLQIVEKIKALKSIDNNLYQQISDQTDCKAPNFTYDYTVKKISKIFQNFKSNSAKCFQSLFNKNHENNLKSSKINANQPLFERKRFENMILWLKNGGAVFPKVEIKYFQPKIYTNQVIDKDEQLICIPKQFLLTLEMAKSSLIGRKIVAADLNLNSPKHSLLSSLLLQEQANPDSF